MFQQFRQDTVTAIKEPTVFTEYSFNAAGH